MKRRYNVIALCMLVPFAASADKVLTGEGVFHAEAYHSMADCREGALQDARVNALAAEYGLTIGQETLSRETTGSRGEDSYFEALSTTEVRGEWVADIGEPRFDVSLSPDGLYIVRCTVKGTTRPLSNEAPEFTAEVLRNGATRRHADTSFRSGDAMAMLFRAPVDGYVAVYLAGADGMAYTLLPYLSDSGGNVKVKGGREYLLFSEESRDLGEPDVMRLVTDVPVERNHVYVLFSPNEFMRADDSASAGPAPRSLSFSDFSKWIAQRRSRDNKMGLKIIPITINQ